MAANATSFKKGQPKIAGKVKGSKNKATIERELVQRYDEEAAATGLPAKKLAKDWLEQFLNIFGNYAAYYQPVPDGTVPPANRKPDPEKFLSYADRAVECAIALAKYQSPTFRAIQVVNDAPINHDDGQPVVFTLTIFEGGRQTRVIDPDKPPPMLTEQKTAAGR